MGFRRTRLALNVDREKAEAMGVSFDEINQTLSVTTGSNYVNDYTNNGRVQQVIVQADAPYRMQPEQLLNIPVKNRLGQMVPLSTFVTQSWAVAPQQLNRYQGYPAIRITGSAAPGGISGTAMAEMETLAGRLPQVCGRMGGQFITGKRVCISAPGAHCPVDFSGVYGAGACMKAGLFRLRLCWLFRWGSSARFWR
jgi:multidrug efflux pump